MRRPSTHSRNNGVVIPTEQKKEKGRNKKQNKTKKKKTVCGRFGCARTNSIKIRNLNLRIDLTLYRRDLYVLLGFQTFLATRFFRFPVFPSFSHEKVASGENWKKKARVKQIMTRHLFLGRPAIGPRLVCQVQTPNAAVANSRSRQINKQTSLLLHSPFSLFHFFTTTNDHREVQEVAECRTVLFFLFFFKSP